MTSPTCVSISGSRRAQLLELAGRDVERDDVRSEPDELEREAAGAGARVEDALPGRTKRSRKRMWMSRPAAGSRPSSKRVHSCSPNSS